MNELMRELERADMSAVLRRGGYTVLILGLLGGALYGLSMDPSKISLIEMVTMLLILVFSVGGGMLLFGMSSVHTMLRILRHELDVVKGVAAMGGGEGRVEMAKTAAAQMLQGVRTYIELEMWAQAFQKGQELINLYPKSEEAKKVRGNLDVIKKKAQEKPAASKPAAAPKPAAAAPAAPAK